MSSPASFLSQISKHVDGLKNLCRGFGKKGLKEQISKASSHLHSKPEVIDLVLVLDPFFSAALLDPKHFQSTVLDCFRTIFLYSNENNYIKKLDFTIQYVFSFNVDIVGQLYTRFAFCNSLSILKRIFFLYL